MLITQEKELSLKTSETVGFSKQVKVVVSSESNPTVKSEILVDFKRKVKLYQFRSLY